MQHQLAVATVDEMHCLGKVMAHHVKPGDCILLKGDLGAGKTELARALIRAWCKDDTLEVTSPTFNLVQTYQRGKAEELWHFDLYRVEHTEELRELAMDEALQNGIVLVEWPERAGDAYWPRDALHLQIGRGETEEGRIVHFSGDARHEYVKNIKV